MTGDRSPKPVVIFSHVNMASHNQDRGQDFSTGPGSGPLPLQMLQLEFVVFLFFLTAFSSNLAADLKVEGNLLHIAAWQPEGCKFDIIASVPFSGYNKAHGCLDIFFNVTYISA